MAPFVQALVLTAREPMKAPFLGVESLFPLPVGCARAGHAMVDQVCSLGRVLSFTVSTFSRGSLVFCGALLVAPWKLLLVLGSDSVSRADINNGKVLLRIGRSAT